MARLIFVTLATLIVSCVSHPSILSRDDQSTRQSFPFISRVVWGARPPTVDPVNLNFPAPFVVIHHTYIPRVCLTMQECINAMRSMQDFHQITNGWSDIGYNFAVGGEGRVYEGRGWDTVGAHAVGYNSRSVGISLIGDFVSTLPSHAQLSVVKRLIDTGVALGHISPDYKLIGHRQVSATECPGEALFQEIRTWDHFTEEW